MSRVAWWTLVALIPLGLAMAASPAAAQQTPRQGQLLREAVGREAEGDLAAAESLLRELLDVAPASPAALMALERVLRVQGRLEAMPPVLERAMAEDPRSPYVNQLRLRTYSALDRIDGLERAARQWITISPLQEVPYREVAEVWEARGEPARALAVLEEGRRVLARADALALPLGDVLARMGDLPAAVRAWGWAIEPDGRGALRVVERIRERPEARPYVAGLIDRLAGDRAPRGRLEAALELALAAEDPDRARTVAGRLGAEVGTEARRSLLDRMATTADAAGHTELAFWAYGALLDVETRLRYAGTDTAGAERLTAGTERITALRNRLAELALALGDSAAAADAFRAVEASSDVGSPGWRAASALRIELTAAEDPDAAASALERFAGEHPGTPELDRVTATVAGALLRDGRREAAEAVLGDVPGPRSSLVRARLRLEAGDAAGARAGYLAAAAGLRGAEATGALRRVTLLGRVSGRAARQVAEALRLRDAGESQRAVAGVMAAVDTGGGHDASPLLAFAAGLADDAGLEAEARRIRERIVAEHPGSPDAPPALLALGRKLKDDPGTRGAARAHLERLILEYPESALVPQARRMLEGLR